MQIFQRDCQKFCKENGYFYYFASNFELPFSALLSQTQTMVAEGEKVLCCILDETITLQVYIRGETSYRHDEPGCTIDVKNTNELKTEAFRNIFKNAIDKFGVKKIVCLSQICPIFGRTDYDKKLALFVKKTLKNDYDDLKIIVKSISDLTFEALYLKTLNGMGEKKNPYLIEPMLLKEFIVVVIHGNNNDDKLMEDENGRITLPYEKSAIIKVQTKNDYVELKNENNEEVYERIALSDFLDQEVNVTLKVDENRFYSFFVKPLIKPQKLVTSLLFKDLSIYSKMKPIILLYENSYSIRISNKNGGYKSMLFDGEKSNNLLLISFIYKKPIIGNMAEQTLKDNPSFVIYDLIQLCSISDPKQADPKWLFTVKFDDAGIKILVEFETFECEKQATPAFLMALIFRDCLNRIKKETGEKVTELDLKLVKINKKIKLKSNLMEAGELLKIKVEVFQ